MKLWCFKCHQPLKAHPANMVFLAYTHTYTQTHMHIQTLGWINTWVLLLVGNLLHLMYMEELVRLIKYSPRVSYFPLWVKNSHICHAMFAYNYFTMPSWEIVLPIRQVLIFLFFPWIFLIFFLNKYLSFR